MIILLFPFFLSIPISGNEFPQLVKETEELLEAGVSFELVKGRYVDQMTELKTFSSSFDSSSENAITPDLFNANTGAPKLITPSSSSSSLDKVQSPLKVLVKSLSDHDARPIDLDPSRHAKAPASGTIAKKFYSGEASRANVMNLYKYYFLPKMVMVSKSRYPKDFKTPDISFSLNSNQAREKENKALQALLAAEQSFKRGTAGEIIEYMHVITNSRNEKVSQPTFAKRKVVEYFDIAQRHSILEGKAYKSLWERFYDFEKALNVVQNLDFMYKVASYDLQRFLYADKLGIRVKPLSLESKDYLDFVASMTAPPKNIEGLTFPRKSEKLSKYGIPEDVAVDFHDSKPPGTGREVENNHVEHELVKMFPRKESVARGLSLLGGNEDP